MLVGAVHEPHRLKGAALVLAGHQPLLSRFVCPVPELARLTRLARLGGRGLAMLGAGLGVELARRGVPKGPGLRIIEGHCAGKSKLTALVSTNTAGGRKSA